MFILARVVLTIVTAIVLRVGGFPLLVAIWLARRHTRVAFVFATFVAGGGLVLRRLLLSELTQRNITK